MTSYVIDASALFEVVSRTTLGEVVGSTIRDRELIAPELIYAEVLATIRRGVLNDSVPQAIATVAVQRLINIPITKYSLSGLIADAWEYRHNVSAYDAFYMAVARKNDTPLVTVDARLSRAPVSDVAIISLR